MYYVGCFVLREDGFELTVYIRGKPFDLGAFPEFIVGEIWEMSRPDTISGWSEMLGYQINSVIGVWQERYTEI